MPAADVLDNFNPPDVASSEFKAILDTARDGEALSVGAAVWGNSTKLAAWVSGYASTEDFLRAALIHHLMHTLCVDRPLVVYTKGLRDRLDKVAGSDGLTKGGKPFKAFDLLKPMALARARGQLRVSSAEFAPYGHPARVIARHGLEAALRERFVFPILPPELLDAVDRRIAAEKGITLPPKPPAQEQPQGDDTEAFQPEPLPEWGVTGPMGVINSVGSGAMEAIFQTRDFVLGEEPQDEKGPFRLQHEADLQQLQQQGWVNNITADISQFGLGLVGAGKLMQPVKVLQQMKGAGAVGRGAWEVARGAVAGFIALDPHEERLSNLIEQYEPLRNPITEYLAADANDSAMEGRFKNALEGIGMDLALVGVLEASLRAIRALRIGDQETAEAALREVEELQTQADGVEVRAQADEAATESTEAAPGQPKARPAETEEPGSAPLESAAKDFPEADAPQAHPDAAEDIPEAAPRVETEGADPAAASPSTASTAAPQRPAAPEAPNVADILDTARADLAAIRTYGSRSEALMAGHRFADRKPLPWTRLRGTEEVQAFVEQAASAVKVRLDAAKGGDVLSDLQVQEMVRQRADAFSEDPAEMMAELVKARHYEGQVRGPL